MHLDVYTKVAKVFHFLSYSSLYSDTKMVVQFDILWCKFKAY